MTDTAEGVSLEEHSKLSKGQSAHVRKRARRLLWSLLKPLRARIAVTMTIILIAQVFAVAGPMLLAYGLDTALPALFEGQSTPAVFAVVGYAVAAVTEALLTAVFIRQTAVVAQAILYDLRRRIFDHTQRLSLEFHESYTSGRIISRQTNDLDSVRELLATALNDLVSGLLYMGFITGAMFVLDVPSGFILLACLVPMGVLFAWFQRQSSVLYRESSTRSAKVIVQFVETMTGIRAVQAFRRERRNQAKYDRLAGDYRDTNLKMMNVFGIFFTVLTLVGNLAVTALVLVNGLRVVDGALGVGVLLASVLYAKQFFDPMDSMAGFYNSFQAAGAALEKISGVLEERPSVPDPVRPVELRRARGEIRFDDVEFGYRDGTVVLPRLDLTIPAGQTVALVGATGAGKTTMAKLIARFYDPTSGRVLIDGVDLRDLHPKDLRRAIVMVTQEAYLFSGSVADNIALGKPNASRAEIEAAARAVGADGFIRALPDGYDTDVNKRGGRVSSGQRQLISFARAFLADPAVLILDEATSSLDIPSERRVQQALETLLSDRTAVIIAHRLSTVEIADRVLVMSRGAIVEDGAPVDLIAGSGEFSALHSAWRDSLV